MSTAIAEPENLRSTLSSVLEDVKKLPETDQRSLMRKWSKQAGIFEEDAKEYEKQARFTQRDKYRVMSQMFGKAVRELRERLRED